jgi:hypothetical protein
MVHLLILLRLVAALFVSPPPSDDGESPPPSPPPPQNQRPVAVFQPLPQLLANKSQACNNHENIIWPGAADHPARRTCQQAGRVGHYRCSPGRPGLRPHPPAQIPHSATNGFQSVHGQEDIELSWEDFDWTTGAAAAAAPYQQRQQQEHHEWSQDDWEEDVSAAAAVHWTPLLPPPFCTYCVRTCCPPSSHRLFIQQQHTSVKKTITRFVLVFAANLKIPISF